MGSQVQEEIIARLRTLDSLQLSEVFDFITFLQQRQPLPDPIAANRLQGKYRERIQPSADFARQKMQEIDIEDEKWRAQ